MSIIDDWLRQHPNLTLTRDQRQHLEELIDEEIDDNDFACGEDFADDDIEDAFKKGARAMRQKIAKDFESLGVTLDISKDVNSIDIPEMPEDEES